VLLREQGAPLPVITVHRILKRHGLVRIKDTHAPALQRFEHEAPNQLWQMDGKGEYRGGEASCFPLSILDDHSRYLLGLYGLRAFTAEQVYPCLVRTFERYGLPEAMLMDRGSIWWGTKNGYGLTWLSVRLIEQGIELRYGRPRHPQTQGKVERFHRTLDEAMRYRGKPQRLAEWMRRWRNFAACTTSCDRTKRCGCSVRRNDIAPAQGDISGGRHDGNIPRAARCVR